MLATLATLAHMYVTHTDPEVIVHVPGEDGVMIVGSMQIGRFGIRLLSVLIFKPLLVGDIHLFPISLHQGDEGLYDTECSVSKRNQDQNLQDEPVQASLSFL